MLSAFRRRMARNVPLHRLHMLANHLTTTTTPQDDPQPPVIFENDRSTRTFILNRPKLNPLDEEMIDLLSAKLKEWDNAELCGMIIGRGSGRAFCAGGNVRGIAKDAAGRETRARAIDFFKKEFHLDFQTANLKTPYIAILDGITMGGGAGLCINAPFRVATEKTIFAMPETKIGYAPDVGASYFLSRLDGEIGTYLALTGNSVSGRDVFKLGLATHYTSSRRIPELLNTLASLEDVKLPSINSTIEEFFAEPHNDEPETVLEGDIREALDKAFSFDDVDNIVAALDEIHEDDGPASEWAEATLHDLHMRSPTSLRIALEAIRRGRQVAGLAPALYTEFAIAVAIINGGTPDFITGVTSKLEQRLADDVRPNWHPPTLAAVTTELVKSRFFETSSPYLANLPALNLPPPSETPPSFLRFSLPSENYVESVVRGTDSSSGNNALTAREVIEKINRTFANKHGVTDKVAEILFRKCALVGDPDDSGCIRWV